MKAALNASSSFFQTGVSRVIGLGSALVGGLVLVGWAFHIEQLKSLFTIWPAMTTTTAFRPDLILLDWNLPKKSGREVLAEIKDDENLKYTPVVALTTPKAAEDVLQAYGLHANCYIAKPMDFDKFIEAVRIVGSFWFSVVILPGLPNNA